MVRLASNAQSNFVVLSEMAADMADMGETPFHTDDCYWISIHMVIREERSPQKLRLEPDPCLMEILMPVWLTRTRKMMALATVQTARMKWKGAWIVASATVPTHVGNRWINASTGVRVNLCVSSIRLTLTTGSFVTVRTVTMNVTLVSSAAISLADFATVPVRTNVARTSLCVWALDVWLRI